VFVGSKAFSSPKKKAKRERNGKTQVEEEEGDTLISFLHPLSKAKGGDNC
jgi:hypothetical protein